ncbi:hypothetical protein [Campylobacter mucosalis]|uniref:hypothetical protein n=1 Tax=Campylobacter mucosalis TaxID=202 RepID=UPI0004D6D5DF|nr:hypothetical protein [Campylobacter mucosalis]KEA45190.1 hypothetical protein CR66_09365 [Campylobacter mucosalis]QKF63850.1 hypothetical protein CMCT_1753 [Campylobacter mucosalis]
MNRFAGIFGGLILIIVSFGIYATKEFRYHYYEPLYLGNYAIFASIIFFAFGLFLIVYKSKHPNFLHCKKCKKVYNYADVKDKNRICPKCKGELQDYKEFKNKNREFQKLDKIEKEFTKKSKN